MQILELTGLGLLGLLLHVIVKFREDYLAMLATPDTEDDKTFWQVWKKRNLVISLVSIPIVVGVVIAQHFITENGLLTNQSVFFVGYALDSALKTFTPKG